MKSCIACKNGKHNHKGWCSNRKTLGKIQIVKEVNGVVLSFKLPTSASLYADQVLKEIEYKAGHSPEMYGKLSV